MRFILIFNLFLQSWSLCALRSGWCCSWGWPSLEWEFGCWILCKVAALLYALYKIICCVFRPAFGCCMHRKAGGKIFSAVFQPFLFILNLFQRFHGWNQQKTSENEQKMCFFLLAPFAGGPWNLPQKFHLNLIFLSLT